MPTAPAPVEKAAVSPGPLHSADVGDGQGAKLCKEGGPAPAAGPPVENPGAAPGDPGTPQGGGSVTGHAPAVAGGPGAQAAAGRVLRKKRKIVADEPAASGVQAAGKPVSSPGGAALASARPTVKAKARGVASASSVSAPTGGAGKNGLSLRIDCQPGKGMRKVAAAGRAAGAPTEGVPDAPLEGGGLSAAPQADGETSSSSHGALVSAPVAKAAAASAVAAAGSSPRSLFEHAAPAGGCNASSSSSSRGVASGTSASSSKGAQFAAGSVEAANDDAAADAIRKARTAATAAEILKLRRERPLMTKGLIALQPTKRAPGMMAETVLGPERVAAKKVQAALAWLGEEKVEHEMRRELDNTSPDLLDAAHGHALAYSAVRGLERCVQFLLFERKVSPNIRDPLRPGTTALQRAVENGQVSTCRLLLDAGADPAGAHETLARLESCGFLFKKEVPAIKALFGRTLS